MAHSKPIATPTSLREVAAYQDKIKDCLEIIEVKEQELDDLKHEIDAQDDLASRYAQAIYEFADDKRAELLPSGSKTYTLPQGGSFSWVTSTRIVLAKKAADIIKSLKRQKLSRYWRVKESLNKEALHDAPERIIKRISGLSREQGELFKIEPMGRSDHLERDFETGAWKRKAPKEKKIQPFAQAAE